MRPQQQHPAPDDFTVKPGWVARQRDWMAALRAAIKAALAARQTKD